MSTIKPNLSNFVIIFLRFLYLCVEKRRLKCYNKYIKTAHFDIKDYFYRKEAKGAKRKKIKKPQKRQNGVFIMKKTSRLLSVCIALSMLLLFIPGTEASAREDTRSGVPVSIDGEYLFNGALIDSITYVPLRKLCEAAVDCDIVWDGQNKTATVYFGNNVIRAGVGDQYISVNGRYFYTVGRILNLDGSLYVPVRAIARALSLEVEWQADTRSVCLSRTQSGIVSGSRFYSSDEVYWLSRIIHAEAGGESFDGKIAVGNVVLTRVESPLYPNTIYGVIFDFKHGIQFTPAYTGTVYNTPSQESIIAAKVCLEGYEIVPGALFFFNPRIATSNWISKNRPFATTIGNHDFYY